jgi:hypothetical protein
MAGSMALAIAAASSPEFDRATGFIVDPPESAPVDPATAANFARHDFKAAFDRVKFGLLKKWRCDPTMCEDALQNALANLLETEPEVLTMPPDEWMGLLFVAAGWQLGMSLRERPRLTSIDSLQEKGDGPFTEARPAVPASIEGMDEDAWLVPPPSGAEGWERLQMVGAAQRFRNVNARPPTYDECKKRWRELGLPPASQVTKEFGSFNAFLLEAGMMPRYVASRRPRELVEAAKACASWRWRQGHWPGRKEIEDPRNGLPSAQTCERHFGGLHESDVQIGVETVLTADELACRRPRAGS